MLFHPYPPACRVHRPIPCQPPLQERAALLDRVERDAVSAHDLKQWREGALLPPEMLKQLESHLGHKQARDEAVRKVEAHKTHIKDCFKNQAAARQAVACHDGTPAGHQPLSSWPPASPPPFYLSATDLLPVPTPLAFCTGGKTADRPPPAAGRRPPPATFHKPPPSIDKVSHNKLNPPADTTMGSFEAELFMDRVPRSASSFIDLAQSGFYSGIHFHRVIAGFMNQVNEQRA